MNTLGNEPILFAQDVDRLWVVSATGLVLFFWRTRLLVKTAKGERTKNRTDLLATITTLPLTFFLLSTFWFAWTSFHDIAQTIEAKAILGAKHQQLLESQNPVMFSTWACLILIATVGPISAITAKLFQPSDGGNDGRRRRASTGRLCDSTQPTNERKTMSRIIVALSCVTLCLAGCSTVTDTGAKHTATSESERIEANKALARVWFDEVINQRNLDAIAEAYAADYVHHGPEGAQMHGIEAARGFAATILAASNDRVAVVEQQVAEGDLVVTRFISRGHHTGVFRGIEPTGRTLTAEGICISRIEDGKIAEDWEIVHQSGM